MSRRLPSAPKVDLNRQAEKMLEDNESIMETMLKLYEQSASMQRKKHMAFVRAGFTDDQAFELSKPT